MSVQLYLSILLHQIQKWSMNNSHYSAVFLIFTCIHWCTIQWTQHSEFQDVVIMSNCNPGTGFLKPLSYVHLTCTTTSNGETSLLKCTCQIYNTIKCAGLSLSNIELLDDEDVLNECITCMHCRFYMDIYIKRVEICTT